MVRSIPVRLEAFEGFLCVMAPGPKLAGLDTGEVKKDRRSGETVWEVGVCAVRGRDSSVERVAVVGEPTGVTLGAPVLLVGLEAIPWERDGRSGVSFRAEKVLPANGSAASAAVPRQGSAASAAAAPAGKGGAA